MTLTKQQKMDMIFDVELRLAKEELAEQYVKNLKTIENSKKPLRTLGDIVKKNTPESNAKKLWLSRIFRSETIRTEKLTTIKG